MNLDHVEGWDAFGDADDQLDPGVSGFQNGIGRERGRDENHCRVGASLLSCFSDGVEDRQTLHAWFRPLPGVTPPTTLVP